MDKKIFTQFCLNGKPYKNALVYHQDTLAKIRINLNLDERIQFSFNDIPIDVDTETEVYLQYISQEKVVNMISPTINIYIDDKMFQSDPISNHLTLDKARKLLKLNDKTPFQFKQLNIEKKDEADTKLGDIIEIENGNNIYLKSYDLKQKLCTPPVQEQIEIQLIVQDHSQAVIKKEHLKYFFSNRDGTNLPLGEYDFELAMSLMDIRQISKLDKKILFVVNHKSLPVDFESEIKLSGVIKMGSQEIIIDDQRLDSLRTYPIQGSKFLRKENELDIYQYPLTKQINVKDQSKSKVLMVVGQTGSGKTTLLNSMVNYHMGVQYHDTYRYVVIVEDTGKSEAYSQTDGITQYLLKQHNDSPSLIIVDTPGFGDTRGMQQDHLLVDLIKSFFDTQLDQVHAICFVMQSANARLTLTQKYIFNEVLKIFGKDIAENFVCITTFCDGGDPPILKGLTCEDSPFKDVMSSIKPPWYIKFNNSAIFQGISQDDLMTQPFWNICMNSFQMLYNLKIHALPVKSLKLTKEVLEIRDNLKIQIMDLNTKNDFVIKCQSSLNDQIIFIQNNKRQIDANSNFDICVEYPTIIQIELQQGEYVTNCTICNYTCHFPCSIAEDENKRGCSAMKRGKCSVCKGKCDWSLHRNMTFKMETRLISKIERSQDIYKAFSDATSNKSISEKLLEGLQNELCAKKSEFTKIEYMVNNLVDTLKGSALRSGVMDSCDDYIDQMIKVYQEERKQGWEKCIKYLQEQKQHSKLLKDAYNKQDKFQQFVQFLDEEVRLSNWLKCLF